MEGDWWGGRSVSVQTWVEAWYFVFEAETYRGGCDSRVLVTSEPGFRIHCVRGVSWSCSQGIVAGSLKFWSSLVRVILCVAPSNIHILPCNAWECVMRCLGVCHDNCHSTLDTKFSFYCMVCGWKQGRWILLLKITEKRHRPAWYDEGYDERELLSVAACLCDCHWENVAVDVHEVLVSWWPGDLWFWWRFRS